MNYAWNKIILTGLFIILLHQHILLIINTQTTGSVNLSLYQPNRSHITMQSLRGLILKKSNESFKLFIQYFENLNTISYIKSLITFFLFSLVSRLDTPIESLDDLSNQYKVQYSPMNATSTMTYFERMAYIEKKFYE